MCIITLSTQARAIFRLSITHLVQVYLNIRQRTEDAKLDCLYGTGMLKTQTRPSKTTEPIRLYAGAWASKDQTRKEPSMTGMQEKHDVTC
jgi:hypothetical protein